MDHSHLSTCVARLARHRAWAERTRRWAQHSRDKDLLDQVKRTIDVAKEVFERAVMRAADDEARKTKN